MAYACPCVSLDVGSTKALAELHSKPSTRPHLPSLCLAVFARARARHSGHGHHCRPSRAPGSPPHQLLHAFSVPAECHYTSTANRRPRCAHPLALSAAVDGCRRSCSRATTGFHGQQAWGHRELSRAVARMVRELLVLALLFSSARRRRCSPATGGRGRSRPCTWLEGHGPPPIVIPPPLVAGGQAGARAALGHRRRRPPPSPETGRLPPLLDRPEGEEDVSSLCLSLCVSDERARLNYGSHMSG
jgi:hypothetical protein